MDPRPPSLLALRYSRHSVIDLFEAIARRGWDAAKGIAESFTLPEAEDAAAWVARRTAHPVMRAEAKSWRQSGANYPALVRLCARAVIAADEPYGKFDARYRSKAEGDLEPMLALCPNVIAVPTTADLSARDMIRLRAFPLHPLGLVDELTWTDGSLAPPSEFFFHDLDHARFKVREDLLVEGIEIPDAYRDGSTIDAATGRHRDILSFARDLIGNRLWARVPTRLATLARLLARADAMPQARQRAAAELLLFEILHEKSFPVEAAVLRRELASQAHLTKLHRKAATRFFPNGIDDAVIDALGSVSSFLTEALD